MVSGPEGLAWDVNRDAISRHLDDILGFPNVPPGHTFAGPTLALAGGRSPYMPAKFLVAVRNWSSSVGRQAGAVYGPHNGLGRHPGHENSSTG